MPRGYIFFRRGMVIGTASIFEIRALIVSIHLQLQTSIMDAVQRNFEDVMYENVNASNRVQRNV